MNQVISQAVGQSTKAFFLLGRIQDWKEVSKMLVSLRRFDQDKVVQERLRIIKFYRKHGGKEAAREPKPAFSFNSPINQTRESQGNDD